uniref:Uncharacterized protein n=1 Tax=Melopsittacus undulatus TaxID=13146 RepID=A0A8V5GHM6_MELUD
QSWFPRPLCTGALSHCPGSLVQAALTQPPSLSVEPGKDAQITCSGGGSYEYGWYQQKVPGSAIVTVIYNNNQRPSAEDRAIYYCVSWDSSSADEHPGAPREPWLGAPLAEALSCVPCCSGPCAPCQFRADAHPALVTAAVPKGPVCVPEAPSLSTGALLMVPYRSPKGCGRSWRCLSTWWKLS